MDVASFVQALASLSWLLVVGAIGFAGFMISRRRSTSGAVGLVIGTIVLSAVLSSVSAGLVFGQPDERAVVISALQSEGIRPQALQPGLRWIIPFFENVVRYPISQQTYTMSGTSSEGTIVGDDSISARTSDGQVVFIDSSIIFRLSRTDVVGVHINWGNRYINDLVRPQARGVIRDVASQFGVEEIVTTRRTELRLEISDLLSAIMAQNGLVLESFVLRNITFTPEYAASIEQKQIAEQDAQRAAFVVQQREQEAQQARVEAQGAADAQVIRAEGSAQATIVQAEADAEALTVVGIALSTNPDLLQFRYVEKLSDPCP